MDRQTKTNHKSSSYRANKNALSKQWTPFPNWQNFLDLGMILFLLTCERTTGLRPTPVSITQAYQLALSYQVIPIITGESGYTFKVIAISEGNTSIHWSRYLTGGTSCKNWKVIAISEGNTSIHWSRYLTGGTSCKNWMNNNYQWR